MQHAFQEKIIPASERDYQHELELAADFQQSVLPEIVDVDYLDIDLIYKPYGSIEWRNDAKKLTALITYYVLLIIIVSWFVKR